MQDEPSRHYFPNMVKRDASTLLFITLWLATPSRAERKERAEKSVHTRSFGVQFEPRYIFRAGRLDQ